MDNLFVLSYLLNLHKILEVKRAAFILFLLIPALSYSQLDIVINTNIVPLYPSDGDTLSTCRDSIIIFEAEVTDGGIPVTNAEYYWDFDDGDRINGTDTDSVSHKYKEIGDDKYKGGGGYRVKLKVVDISDQTGFTILPVRVAIPPNYKGTKVNIPEDQNGICKGSTTELIGKAYPEVWEDDPNYEFTEFSSNYFDDLEPYTSFISIDEFPLNSIYASGNIDSISLNLIHTDMGNLKITLNCETGGDTVLLKDFSSTNHAVLGDTINDELFTYYWSAGFTETMNSSSIFDNGSGYLPDESFDNLNGCSLNGNWTINIEDNQYPDSGFVYSWAIFFKQDIVPPVWTFHDSLKIYKVINEIPYGTYWQGSGISILGETNPVFLGDTIIKYIQATSNIYGANGCDFNVITNWGCPQDTSVNLIVEEVVIEPDVTEGDAPLEVNFKDLTSWAVYRDWDFGDNETFQHVADTVAHEYLEGGITYTAVLISTDQKGCTDSDTVKIVVSVETSMLDITINTFTPNGDTFNEIFKLTEDDVKGMREFKMIIYNRYGQKVFESNDYKQMITVGWDGKTQPLGIMASPGVYFYVIRAIGKDKEIDLETGKEDYKKYKDEAIKGSIYIFRD
jgi:gliding motility-associated-like protein